MTPFVSIVVTCYNQDTTLAQTIDSILLQECSFEFEIIIGDDHSSDCSRNICLMYKDKYPEIVHLIFQETNVGVAKNWISCIQASKGLYIAACAADDYWHCKKKLETQINFLRSNPNYGLVYTDYNVLEVKTGKIVESYLKLSKQKIYHGENLIKNIFKGQVPILPATAIFRKDIFDQYVPIKDFIKYCPIEDWPTWIILSKYCSIGYIDISTATYRRGHESLSNISDYEETKNRFNDEHQMYKYLCSLFPDDLNYYEAGYLIYIDTILLSLSYKKNDFKNANIYAKKLHLKGFRNIKTVLASNWILFNVFTLLKKLLASKSFS